VHESLQRRFLGPWKDRRQRAKTAIVGCSETANAKTMLALSLVKCFLLWTNQPSEYRKRIEELFESHPDHDPFGSLPGAGPKLAPRLLAQIGD
jgi:hypothetical protein